MKRCNWRVLLLGDSAELQAALQDLRRDPSFAGHCQLVGECATGRRLPAWAFDGVEAVQAAVGSITAMQLWDSRSHGGKSHWQQHAPGSGGSGAAPFKPLPSILLVR